MAWVGFVGFIVEYLVVCVILITGRVAIRLLKWSKPVINRPLSALIKESHCKHNCKYAGSMIGC